MAVCSSAPGTRTVLVSAPAAALPRPVACKRRASRVVLAAARGSSSSGSSGSSSWSSSSSGPSGPLFALDGHTNASSLTLEDVRDAYEVCSLIPNPSERRECYSVFGLDAGRMSAYYETVVSLEASLGRPCGAGCSGDEEEESEAGHWGGEAVAAPRPAAAVAAVGGGERGGGTAAATAPRGGGGGGTGPAAITGDAPPPPAAAAALAVGMLFMAAKHLVWLV